MAASQTQLLAVEDIEDLAPLQRILKTLIPSTAANGNGCSEIDN